MKQASALTSILLAALAIAAVCGSSKGSTRFPGPNELAADSQFSVILDSSREVSGERFLVLGSDQTFADLGKQFTSELRGNGWTILQSKPITRGGITAPPVSADEGLVARKGQACISYWNMKEGTFGAAGDRPEARRIEPDFDALAARYRTVFRVTPIHECA